MKGKNKKVYNLAEDVFEVAVSDSFDAGQKHLLKQFLSFKRTYIEQLDKEQEVDRSMIHVLKNCEKFLKAIVNPSKGSEVVDIMVWLVED